VIKPFVIKHRTFIIIRAIITFEFLEKKPNHESLLPLKLKAKQNENPSSGRRGENLKPN
jgi:hypothetical protein